MPSVDYKAQEAQQAQQRIDAIYDRLTLHPIRPRKRATLLFEVKQLCLRHALPRPYWWYRLRNLGEWLLDDGSLVYPGIDLGGF